MTASEFAIEALRLVVPAVLAYIGVMRNRVELDILYAKQRGSEQKMRRRWYTPLFHKRKEIANVARIASGVAVESHREGVPGEVPVGSAGEGPSADGPTGERRQD